MIKVNFSVERGDEDIDLIVYGYCDESDPSVGYTGGMSVDGIETKAGIVWNEDLTDEEEQKVIQLLEEQLQIEIEIGLENRYVD